MKHLYRHISYTCLMLMLSLVAIAQDSVQLTILHTSDMHSRVQPIDRKAVGSYAGMGGLLRRTVLVDEQRKEDADLLLFDCGDFSQGTPYYNLFKGKVEIEMMNFMHYDAITIGNHEFDFGLENMANLFKQAQFPVVCANYDFTGTILESLVKPYVILERKGLKIGVFGLSPKMEGLVQADKCMGVTFSDPYRKAQEMADLLRNKEHCDLVICLSHLGLQGFTASDCCDEEMVAKTHGIDLILGGHSHTYMDGAQNYLNQQGKTVPILHSGSNGVFVGKMVMTLENN